MLKLLKCNSHTPIYMHTHTHTHKYTPTHANEDFAKLQFSSVLSLSGVWLFAAPWTAACQSSMSYQLPELAQTYVHWVSDAIQTSRPLSSLLLLPSIFPSIKVFSNELVFRIRWPKYWNFSISPFNEYSPLISFRMDWLDLLAVQRTLKSFL